MFLSTFSRILYSVTNFRAAVQCRMTQLGLQGSASNRKYEGQYDDILNPYENFRTPNTGISQKHHPSINTKM